MQQRYGRSMAERAFDVYDTKGEKAMISFLIENRDQRQAGTPVTFLLQDNSSVQKDPEGRTYLDPETGDTRDRTPGMHIPLPLRPAVPMMAKPNSDTVLAKLMELVAREAQDKIGREMDRRGSGEERPSHPTWLDAEMMNLYEVLTAAPSAGQAVRRGMDFRNEGFLPIKIRDALDEHETECASLALDRFLPNDQREKLVQAMVRKIEEDSGNARQPEEGQNTGRSFEIEIERVPGPETRYAGRVLPQDHTAEVHARGTTREEVRSMLETGLRQALGPSPEETVPRPGTWRETISVGPETPDQPDGQA